MLADHSNHSVVVVGHVDHGKSSLLGRLLIDTDSVAQDKLDKVKSQCEARSVRFEPAFIFDALKEEQEQGISIDTTRVHYRYGGDRFVLIDAPGHIEFLKNMTTGASLARVGLLVIDTSQGIRSQTLRHLRVLKLLGINEVIVAINKIDLDGYKDSTFMAIAEEIRKLLEDMNLACAACIPISALNGDNIVKVSSETSWYYGNSLLECVLETCRKHAMASEQNAVDDGVLRIILQDVYKFDERRRHYAGLVQKGVVKVGDKIFFSPSGKQSAVKSIDHCGVELQQAGVGRAIALQLTEEVFVERGELISGVKNAPTVDTEIKVELVWFGTVPFDPAKTYLLKVGTAEVECQLVIDKHSVVDSDASTRDGDSVANGSFVEATIKTKKPVAFDTASGVNKFVLCDRYQTLAACVAKSHSKKSFEQPKTQMQGKRDPHPESRDVWQNRNGHKGTVLWFTGLPGAGKSTLARSLEKTLFQNKNHVVVLDADDIRLGLCADLTFSKEARTENIRRLAHLARLFLQKGFIVVVACISPYEEDRAIARQIIGDDDFHEVFVFCPLERCIERDPKGLYKKAQTGQLSQMTGFDTPYQPPSNPSVRLDSGRQTVEQEIDTIMSFLVASRIAKTERVVSTVESASFESLSFAPPVTAEISK